MFTDTHAELRMAQHTARTERVNREGWMREKSAPIRRNRTRRHFGAVLVRFGYWLQGMPVGRAANPVTV